LNITTFWGASIGALIIAAVASFADRRRSKRKNLDKVGFMPWPLIMILAMLTSAVFAAYALKL
jgi:DMSO reductase anchor subunit